MPTSTNLSLVTPGSTAFVTNGASDMTTLANGIDAYWGAPTVYTPVWVGSNISAGAGDFRYRKVGRLGFVIAQFSAGSVAVAGTIEFPLPSGWTNITAQYPVTAASTGAGLLFAQCLSGASSIRVWGASTVTNWGAGASLAGLRINATLQLAA